MSRDFKEAMSLKVWRQLLRKHWVEYAVGKIVKAIEWNRVVKVSQRFVFHAFFPSFSVLPELKKATGIFNLSINLPK